MTTDSQVKRQIFDVDLIYINTDELGFFNTVKFAAIKNLLHRND